MIAFLTRSKPKAPPPGPRDSVREVCETVVFVVALVLLLKLFVVEAFVIPTGSMAETLYGYHKTVHCPECEHDYAVNCSDEVEPQDGEVRPVLAATCPNCRYRVEFSRAYNPSPTSGDRVLVHKALYPLGVGPDRGDVVVFKYPVAPQTNHAATNYIKRLCGVGGETIAIYRGDLYVHPDLAYPEDALDDSGRALYKRPAPGRELHVWEGREPSGTSGDGVDFTYRNAEVAAKAFEASRRAGFPAGGGFELIHKSTDQCLAMRRLVYDNDQQSKTLSAHGVPPRWSSPGWATDSPTMPTVFTHAGPERGVLEYAHRVGGPRADLVDANNTPILQAGNPVRLDDWQRVTRQGGVWNPQLFKPARVTNFLGYNTGEIPARKRDQDPREATLELTISRPGNGDFWVPDLMVECRAQISSERDEVALDLAKGGRRFRATFKDGKVSLGVAKLDGEPEELTSAPTRLTRAGKYRLRFGDFDGRLRVWVNGTEIEFGTAADVPPWDDATSPPPGVDADGFCEANDLKPARIHAAGGVAVSEVNLWEDSYYTPDANRANVPETLYVQPGHYLCLGDNSGFSSDSRFWGLVPERLLLGKAQFIFFPLGRLGFIK